MTATATSPNDSVARKIHRERLMLLGWGRAIAMQFAHPLIAAAVADHSTFHEGRVERLRRLHGTVRAMLAVTFGDDETVHRTARGINHIHDRVHGVLKTAAGPFPAGTPYSAHDEVLLQWVLITLLDSMPLVYTRFIGPLSAIEQDRYCQESTRLGLLLGIPDAMIPQRMSEVQAATRRELGSGTLVVTDTARRLMRDVLYPPFQLAYWPAARVIRLATIGLLDEGLRAQYGWEWTSRDERALQRWTRRLHTLRSVAPDRVRYWPD
jgi:uncharacterized protein (DUF2236 family)